MAPRIFLLDTYYPDFLKGLSAPVNGNYETELRKLLAMRFGTFDAYSYYLTEAGWEAADVVANYDLLQGRWAMEHRGWTAGSPKSIVLEQIAEFKPDVVFCQDLSFFDAATLESLGRRYLLAGQCSCPMPDAQKVGKFALLFTSFPHYVQRFLDMGVRRAEYLPLAFDPRVLPAAMPARQFDIAFVGGVGKQSHWFAGTDVLERVAAQFKDRFVWFGYGNQNLSATSPLKACYGGQAWGTALYDVYLRAKIVINRHGEVAEGYTNNLRCFEATGCGAVLLTEMSDNLRQLFPKGVGEYSDVNSLINQIEFLLRSDVARSVCAAEGQKQTLEHHTYAQRMKVVSAILQEALVAA